MISHLPRGNFLTSVFCARRCEALRHYQIKRRNVRALTGAPWVYPRSWIGANEWPLAPQRFTGDCCPCTWQPPCQAEGPAAGLGTKGREEPTRAVLLANCEKNGKKKPKSRSETRTSRTPSWGTPIVCYGEKHFIPRQALLHCGVTTVVGPGSSSYSVEQQPQAQDGEPHAWVKGCGRAKTW